MSQIDELQGRILSAMARIGTGVDALADRAPAHSQPDPGLEAALEDEKLANAQLEERLRALKQTHADDIVALRAELDNSDALAKLKAEAAEQAEALTRLDGDLRRLRLANDQLRESNAALREANQSGVGEPHLINKAMLAELEGLRASQAAEMAEARAVLAQIEPMLEQAADHSNREGA